MKKKYPRRTVYVSDINWEMVNWLAGQLRSRERKEVSVSEVLRRLIEEKYRQMGGPEVGANDADEPDLVPLAA